MIEALEFVMPSTSGHRVASTPAPTPLEALLAKYGLMAKAGRLQVLVQEVINDLLDLQSAQTRAAEVAALEAKLTETA